MLSPFLFLPPPLCSTDPVCRQLSLLLVASDALEDSRSLASSFLQLFFVLQHLGHPGGGRRPRELVFAGQRPGSVSLKPNTVVLSKAGIIRNTESWCCSKSDQFLGILGSVDSSSQRLPALWIIVLLPRKARLFLGSHPSSLITITINGHWTMPFCWNLIS